MNDVKRWDESAEEYDQYTEEYPQYDELNEELAAFTDISPGSTVFDIGCGTGKTTQYLLQEYEDVDIVGVDPAENMLQRYRERFPNHETYQKRARNAPFDQEHPDHIVLSASMWYTDFKRVLERARTSSPSLYFSINQTFLTFTDTPSHRSSFIRHVVKELDKRGYQTPSLSQYDPDELHSTLHDHGWEVTRQKTIELTPADQEDSAVFFSIPGVAPFFDTVTEKEQKEILDHARTHVDGPSGKNKWNLYELRNYDD